MYIIYRHIVYVEFWYANYIHITSSNKIIKYYTFINNTEWARGGSTHSQSEYVHVLHG